MEPMAFQTTSWNLDGPPAYQFYWSDDFPPSLPGPSPSISPMHEYQNYDYHSALRPPPSAAGIAQIPQPLIMPAHNGIMWPSEIVSQVLPAPHSTNKSRRKLRDDVRRQICLEAEQNPDRKQSQIGADFNVDRTTVSKILRQKEKYMASSDPSRENDEPSIASSPESQQKIKRHKSAPDMRNTSQVPDNSRPLLPFPIQDDNIPALHRIYNLLEDHPDVANSDDFKAISKLIEKLKLLRSPSRTFALRKSLARPYHCDKLNPQTGQPCNSVFSWPQDLTRHDDTIHNAPKFKVRCHLCEKMFSRKDARAKHMRVVHPDVDWAGKQKRKRPESDRAKRPRGQEHFADATPNKVHSRHVICTERLA